MTVVVKLGSSIVAAESGELRGDVLASVCGQVADLHEGGEEVALVSSGAIALGMRLMGLPARPRAIDELQAASAVGQGTVFRAYEERLVAREIHAAQVLLTSQDFSARMNYLNARQTLRRLLAWRAVPVVNENDTTATDEITFGDNDFLAAQVAILLEARLLVLLTDMAGLHTADPRSHPDARMIETVEGPADLEGVEAGDRTSAFGLGGMRSKVAAAQIASSSGIEVVICDGTKPGTLAEAVGGEKVGTRFAAHGERDAGFKLWIRHAKPAHGRVLIDAGAATVLRERGSSLLPVGITAVEGRFDAGDAVDVFCDGDLIGKGLVSYSSVELDRIKGMKSADVLELMPHAAEEAVHRDHFVLA